MGGEGRGQLKSTEERVRCPSMMRKILYLQTDTRHMRQGRPEEFSVQTPIDGDLSPLRR